LIKVVAGWDQLAMLNQESHFYAIGSNSSLIVSPEDVGEFVLSPGKPGQESKKDDKDHQWEGGKFHSCIVD
jgi:hypothetical protein